MTQMNKHGLLEALQLYFIMGSVNCVIEPSQVLKEAIRGGITMFQYREKGDGALTGIEKIKLAITLRDLCHAVKIPFIVNDDIDLALFVDADGVHIGQKDDPIEAVREKIGNKRLGVSVHNLEEAIIAQEKGADYIGVGPIFPTKTKADTRAVRGVKILQTLKKAGISLPMVGIGGINGENAEKVMKAGADGIAVISAISLANNIERVTSELKRIVSGQNI